MLGIILLVAAVAVSTAQSTCPMHAQHAEAAKSPHAGEESRPLKALSADQIEQYRAGKGMGLALAAELNHYPGPRHVLDNADAVGLTAEQRTAIAASHDGMLSEAKRLGEAVVREEERLDAMFASRSIDETALRAATARIAQLQGELRFVHLRAHLQITRLMTAEQIANYDHLRGYERH